MQPPVPVKPWDGIFDATKDGKMCVQNAQNLSGISEDCLILNIYTPDIMPKRPKSVIVFIHPGTESLHRQTEVERT